MRRKSVDGGLVRIGRSTERAPDGCSGVRFSSVTAPITGSRSKFTKGSTVKNSKHEVAR